jgi:hypothetical protein
VHRNVLDERSIDRTIKVPRPHQFKANANMSDDCVCTMEYAPVNDTGGTEYSNACMAACAGLKCVAFDDRTTWCIPEGCTNTYDGCNTCLIVKDMAACTKMYCAPRKKRRIPECATTSMFAQISACPVCDMVPALASGCHFEFPNTTMEDGCLEFPCGKQVCCHDHYDNCTHWNDGCNTCTCSVDGYETCTEQACETLGSPGCVNVLAHATTTDSTAIRFLLVLIPMVFVAGVFLMVRWFRPSKRIVYVRVATI